MSNKESNIVVVDADELYNTIRQVVRAELYLNNKRIEQVSHTVNGLTEKPLYKAEEVCKMLNISRQTLYNWSKEGLIEQRKIKSRLYYLQSDIQALLKAQSA